MKTTFAAPEGPHRPFALITLIAALALPTLLAGCVSTNKLASKTISIESDPSGMRVEVNGEDLGNTPTSYTVVPNGKGDFAGSWGDSPSVMFTAFPPADSAGLYKQKKVFTPSAFMEAGDRVPSRIFFDMYEKNGR